MVRLAFGWWNCYDSTIIILASFFSRPAISTPLNISSIMLTFTCYCQMGGAIHTDSIDRITTSGRNRYRLPVSRMNKLGCYLTVILSSIYGLNAADNLTCEGELTVGLRPQFARQPANSY